MKFLAVITRVHASLVVLILASAPRLHADPNYDAATATIGRATRSVAPGKQSPLVETLHGVNVDTDQLLAIDKATATSVVVGSVNSPVVGGLAYDSLSDLLYGTDTSNGNLVTIVPSTGATALVGNTGVGLLHGLARDPSTGMLYASDADGVSNSRLWRLDPATGVATLVGPIGFATIAALDFDPVSGALYGARGGADPSGVLITINTSTGAGALVAGTRRFTGIAFDTNGDLYGEDNGGLGEGVSRLFLVNKTTGSETLIGTIVAGNVLAVAFNLSVTVPTKQTTWADVKALYRGSTTVQ